MPFKSLIKRAFKVLKMNKQLVVLLFISILSSLIVLIAARTSDELRVTLPNGSKLVGRTLRSHGGRSIKSFLAVPYAKPPLGHLRFKVNFYIFKNLTLSDFFFSFESFIELDVRHMLNSFGL